MLLLAWTTGVLLMLASLSAAHCPRICPHHHQPVCGSDNRTYDNDCKLLQAICRNALIKKHYNGTCKPRIPCSESCSSIYDPVCGTDGRNYNNPCFLRVSACTNPILLLRVLYKGKC
ncbi:four-domain proteases inhibitor-like isoform X2 [Cherax quadricarinatus]